MEEQTIIINDLLSFLWCKGDVVPRDTLLKCVKSFYADQFACDALNSLLTAVPVDIKRKQLNCNPFVAILDVLEQLPKEQVPTLVCRNLNNVPDLDSCAKSSDVFNDKGIYTEHKRLVTDLKSLNKSLFDLSSKLHRLSEKSSKFEKEEVEIESEEDILNDTREIKEKSDDSQVDDSVNTSEELGMGLIANRYQRALARRVEKGKDFKVKKIKPLLFDSAAKSDQHLQGHVITSSPFFKIDSPIKFGRGNISTRRFKQEESQYDLQMDEDYDEDEPFSDSMENDVDDPMSITVEGSSATDSAYCHTRVNTESGIGTSFRCPYCGNEFNSDDWRVHVRNCHGSDGQINPEDFYCSKCDIFFASKKVLGFHMGFHDISRPFECQECKYRFYTQRSVESHTKLHFVDFRHKCPFCYFQAYKLSRVKEHIRSHTGEKPYKCPMCDYATSSYTTLVRGHMHAHSDMRAFKCDQCEKCYKTKSKLQLHMRSHSTEKVYKCSVCGMGFNKSYKLTIHFKGHLTDKTYGCSKCDFITKKTSELRKHMKETH